MRPNPIPPHLPASPYPAVHDHYCPLKVGRRAWRLFACPACPIRRKRMNGRRGLRTADKLMATLPLQTLTGHTQQADKTQINTLGMWYLHTCPYV